MLSGPGIVLGLSCNDLQTLTNCNGVPTAAPKASATVAVECRLERLRTASSLGCWLSVGVRSGADVAGPPCRATLILLCGRGFAVRGRSRMAPCAREPVVCDE